MKQGVIFSAMAGILIACSFAWAREGTVDVLAWSALPPLPPVAGASVQPGVAGAFAGVHNDGLIVAGGANFPDGLPWARMADGSNPRKIYKDDIYLLRREGKQYRWRLSDTKLPDGISYGVSIPTAEGVLCVGGEWRSYGEKGVQKFKSDRVFLLKHIDGDVVISDRLDEGAESFPVLPQAVAAMAGAKIGDTIYILGGNNGNVETRNCWRLDLGKRHDPDHFVWEPFPAWPGPPRSHLIAASQSDGANDCLFIFSGRYKDENKGWVCLTDAYKFDPNSEKWTTLSDVGTGLGSTNASCVMAAPGIETGAQHILIFGGASGERFVEVEQELPRKIAALLEEGKDKEARALTDRKNQLYTDHPGFSRTIWAYHTVTDSWTPAGTFPQANVLGLLTGSHVTATAVKWGEAIIIPSGEVRPGVRSAGVWKASATMPKSFGGLNYVVLAIYLGALVLMGLYFSRREKSTDDFFKAGGRIPWWAAGLSIFGTQLSAITFMAIPAKSFSTDWTWFVMNMTIIMVAPFVVFLFLPFYRRLNVTTAYEYMELRFNIITRLLGSFLFMLFQLARIGIVLYLPSIALSIVTGIDITTCIIVMATLSILYTVLGGIEAVIWTDVMQVVVLMGGALLVLMMIPFHVPGGWNGMIDLAETGDKLRLLDFHFDLKSPTFWVLVLGGFGGNLISYGSDQAVVQRYLTTKDERSAARAIWTNAILTIPATFVFFGIGTALYAFFKSHPATLSPAMEQADAIFPWFIITQLPPGISGLLIAGVFAAAMSSLDSSMNSVATAYTTDFYKRLKPVADDQRLLKIARIVTVIVGILGLGLALLMATWEIKSLWDQFARFIGLFGGGLGGLFILAIFTKRTNSYGAIAGLVGSGVVQWLLRDAGSIHGVFFSVTGILSCCVIGYVVSRLMPRGVKSLEGLTLYSIPSTRPRAEE